MSKRANGIEWSELRGSRPWTAEEGRRVVEAWEESGESVAVFARKAGLVRQRVSSWIGRARGERPEVGQALVPVTVVGGGVPARGWGAGAVVTAEGLCIEVGELDASSAEWVATIVRKLREARS